MMHVGTDERVDKPVSRPGPQPGDHAVRVAFVTTSMGVGGAERLLVELIRRMDRDRFHPVLICLKEPELLGEQLARSGMPVYARLSHSRLDLGVLRRLTAVLRAEQVRVVCTVGTGGDRSFWGR